MKGFYEYLAPFAPDYSGAVAVAFDTGALTVLCDPGGCSGNVCGYDEPRFYDSENALYSAAIRDMDVILGKDDLLARKLLSAAAERSYPFAVLVGTPVVSVVATDLNALCHMVEKKTGIPAISVDTCGMDHYDVGQDKMTRALIRRFAADGEGSGEKTLILGWTPLDMEGLLHQEALAGENTVIFGGPETLDTLRNLRRIGKCRVLSPSALPAAKELEKRFGIPYEAGHPVAPAMEEIGGKLEAGKKVLILHQQYAANGLRELLEEKGCEQVTVGSFFAMDEEQRREGDLHFADEEEFREILRGYDTVICDPLYFAAMEDMALEKIPFGHFALSGDIYL